MSYMDGKDHKSPIPVGAWDPIDPEWRFDHCPLSSRLHLRHADDNKMYSDLCDRMSTISRQHMVWGILSALKSLSGGRTILENAFIDSRSAFSGGRFDVPERRSEIHQPKASIPECHLTLRVVICFFMGCFLIKERNITIAMQPRWSFAFYVVRSKINGLCSDQSCL